MGFQQCPESDGVCCISFGSFRLFSLVLGVVEGSRLDSMSFSQWLLSSSTSAPWGMLSHPLTLHPVFLVCIWWGLWRTSQWVCLPFVFYFLTSTYSAVSNSLTISAELFLVESSVASQILKCSSLICVFRHLVFLRVWLGWLRYNFSSPGYLPW